MWDWVNLTLQDLSLCSLFKDTAPYCLRPNTLIYQKCRGRARAWASAFSPQGGESGGGIGMRLARQPHHPASQISLPVGLWEGGYIIKSPGMSSGLMRWMTGGWITSNRRFQLPFSFRWWWLSWQYFQAAVKNSNSVRCLCVHHSWGSCISTHSKHSTATFLFICMFSFSHDMYSSILRHGITLSCFGKWR